MVVVTGDGIVMLFVGSVEVPTKVPPQLPEYKFRVAPEPPDAESVMLLLLLEQTVSWSLDTDDGAAGKTPKTCAAAKDVSLYAGPRAGS